MDLLKAEINRKRKATEEIKGADSSKSRFIRQKDVIMQQQREREQIARELEEKEKEAALKRRQAEIASGLKPQPKDNSAYQNASPNDTESKDMSKQKSFHDATIALYEALTPIEVKKRLRDIRQPITLFGETDEDRLNRFRDCAMSREFDDQDDIRDDRKQDDDDQAHDDDDDDDEDDQSVGSADSKDQKDKNKSDKKDKTNSSSDGSSSRKNQEPVLYSMIPNYPPEKMVYKYFKGLMKQWERDLNERDDRVRLSMKGKMDVKIQKQCKDYMRPLLRMCKKKQIDSPDMLLHLVEIVKLCEQGNFRAAHEEYLRTAIGNAAWPIGLTMVGIHERSGRERISTSKIAHVMNNEQQRKYLTSVRRLMTYAQTKRPDIAPSMKVF